MQQALEKWLYFLRHAARLDTEALPPSLQGPEIRKAFEKFIMLTQSERDWAKYEERFRAELEARSFKPAFVQEGFQQGLLKGLVDRIHFCQRLLRQPQAPKEELLALPEAHLQQLAALLEQQLEQQLAGSIRPPLIPFENEGVGVSWPVAKKVRERGV